jgi:formylglycine-generating enzyme required for sulfatase activity
MVNNSLLLLISVILFFSCTPREKFSDSDEWGECYSNVQCKGGQICRNNKCVKPFKHSSNIKLTAPFEMVYVPSGEFVIGNNSGSPIERPQISTVTGHYYIDQKEVTVAEYQICVDKAVCKPAKCDQGTNSQAPIVCVNQHNADSYCKFQGKRLPTQEEWEKSSRGTDARRFPWGEQKPDCNLAHFKGCSQTRSSTGLLKKGRSPYGTFDQSGNVWEWTSTRRKPWDPLKDPKKQWVGYKKKSVIPSSVKSKSKKKIKTTDHFIIRGGSFMDEPEAMRSSINHLVPYTFYSNLLGFRCAKDITP